MASTSSEQTLQGLEPNSSIPYKGKSMSRDYTLLSAENLSQFISYGENVFISSVKKIHSATTEEESIEAFSQLSIFLKKHIPLFILTHWYHAEIHHTKKELKQQVLQWFKTHNLPDSTTAKTLKDDFLALYETAWKTKFFELVNLPTLDKLDELYQWALSLAYHHPTNSFLTEDNTEFRLLITCGDDCQKTLMKIIALFKEVLEKCSDQESIKQNTEKLSHYLCSILANWNHSKTIAPPRFIKHAPSVPMPAEFEDFRYLTLPEDMQVIFLNMENFFRKLSTKSALPACRDLSPEEQKNYWMQCMHSMSMTLEAAYRRKATAIKKSAPKASGKRNRLTTEQLLSTKLLKVADELKLKYATSILTICPSTSKPEDDALFSLKTPRPKNSSHHKGRKKQPQKSTLAKEKTALPVTQKKASSPKSPTTKLKNTGPLSPIITTDISLTSCAFVAEASSSTPSSLIIPSTEKAPSAPTTTEKPLIILQEEPSSPTNQEEKTFVKPDLCSSSEEPYDLLTATSSSTSTPIIETPAVPPTLLKGISIRDIPQEIIRILHYFDISNSYIVGGFVRKKLLEILCPDVAKTPFTTQSDIDIVTCASAEMIQHLPDNFSNIHTVHDRTSVVHGLYKLILLTNTGKISIDIMRKPTLDDLEEEARSRDFTVNTLYFSIKQGEFDCDIHLQDPLNSLEDLKNRVVRAIGEFSDIEKDPKRILRALRLVTEHFFVLEDSLKSYIQEHGRTHLETGLSHQKIPIMDALWKGFQQGDALSFYQILCEFNLFSLFFPEAARLLEIPEKKASIEANLRYLNSISPEKRQRNWLFHDTLQRPHTPPLSPYAHDVPQTQYYTVRIVETLVLTAAPIPYGFYPLPLPTPYYPMNPSPHAYPYDARFFRPPTPLPSPVHQTEPLSSSSPLPRHPSYFPPQEGRSFPSRYSSRSPRDSHATPPSVESHGRGRRRNSSIHSHFYPRHTPPAAPPGDFSTFPPLPRKFSRGKPPTRS